MILTSVSLRGCTWNDWLSGGRQLLTKFEPDLASLWNFLPLFWFSWKFVIFKIRVEKYKTVCTNSKSWSLASKWIHCANETKAWRFWGVIWASFTPKIKDSVIKRLNKKIDSWHKRCKNIHVHYYLHVFLWKNGK